MGQGYRLVVFIMCLLYVSGCSTDVQVVKLSPKENTLLIEDKELNREARSRISALSADQKPRDYTIGLKDVLNIEVWQQDQPEIQRSVKVFSNGEISYPLIGNINVLGKTEAEISDLVGERISKFIKDPFVSTRITSVKSKKIYIFGEVEEPGVFPLADQNRVLDVILRAGGTTENADLSQALFIRDNMVLPVDFYGLMRKGVMVNNIYIQHNDKILIPNLEDSKIFVFGEVRKPGVVFLNRQLFLMDAISQCSGLTPEAKTTSVRIIRGTLADPSVYIVNLNYLINGHIDHNIELKRGDIVFVPAKGVVHWGRFMDRILPSLTDIFLLERLSSPAP